MKYLTLLTGAGLITGISKYSGKVVVQKASSPKLQVYNTALISAQNPISFAKAEYDRQYWSRLVESAVGAQLLNEALKNDIKVYYWRERDSEVDYILQKGERIVAIEVKSGVSKGHSGIMDFKKKYKVDKMLLVGGSGIPLEQFFKTNLNQWFD